MCRLYRFVSNAWGCHTEFSACILKQKIQKCINRGSPECHDAQREPPHVISIPVPCHHHLGTHLPLTSAAADYNVAIRDTRCNGRPKKDLLRPEVRTRVDDFETDCVEELWIAREAIIDQYLACWGYPEGSRDHGSGFRAHIQTCINRLRNAIEVFQDDRRLRCRVPLRHQPRAARDAFWCWGTANPRPYPLQPGVAYSPRLGPYYVPPPSIYLITGSD